MSCRIAFVDKKRNGTKGDAGSSGKSALEKQCKKDQVPIRQYELYAVKNAHHCRSLANCIHRLGITLRNVKRRPVRNELI